MCNYYVLLMVLCSFSFAKADQTSNKRINSIIYDIDDDRENDKYVYRYVTANNIISMEIRELLTTSEGKKYIKVLGHYSYVDPNGFLRRVDYTADEKGYHAKYEEPIPFSSKEDKDKVVSMYNHESEHKSPKVPQAPGAAPGLSTHEAHRQEHDSQNIIHSFLGTAYAYLDFRGKEKSKKKPLNTKNKQIKEHK